MILGIVILSILSHHHPSMDGLQEELRQKAPALFRIFVLGEGVYFAGMLVMAAGLGASLGRNPLRWGQQMKMLLSATSPSLSKARLFWVGFAMNVIGSLTFAGLGIYAALTILPHGASTLVPAALVDLTFSLSVRFGLYRRLSGSHSGEHKKSPRKGTTKTGGH